jgi:hypothetical protein
MKHYTVFEHGTSYANICQRCAPVLPRESLLLFTLLALLYKGRHACTRSIVSMLFVRLSPVIINEIPDRFSLNDHLSFQRRELLPSITSMWRSFKLLRWK